MNKLNDLLEKLARPLKDYSSCLLRIGLGVSFFLHGYGKVPIQQGFIDWLASKGLPFAELTAFLVAWGEMLAGIGILIGGLVGLVLLFRAMTKTKFWRDLTSPDIQKKEDGYVASFGWEKLVGEEALTETDLHPSGWVNVGKERVFAISEGNFIDKNVKVVILSVDGNRVVVRKK